jgi:hypothetical protein
MFYLLPQEDVAQQSKLLLEGGITRATYDDNTKVRACVRVGCRAAGWAILLEMVRWVGERKQNGTTFLCFMVFRIFHGFKNAHALLCT